MSKKIIRTALLTSIVFSLTACQGTIDVKVPNIVPSGVPGVNNPTSGNTENNTSGNTSGNNTGNNSGSNTSNGSSGSSPGSSSGTVAPAPSTEDPSKPLTVQNSGLFTRGQQEFFKIIGTPSTDEMLATIAAGQDGTIFFAGHHTQVLDRFSNDLFVGAMGSDGSLKWMKSFNGEHHQQFKDSGQNAEAGGNQHAMVVGPDGFIYLTAQASPAVQNNLFYTMVTKLDPKTGEAVWSKLWNPAPDLATAKTNAQSYGLDVDNNKVYITGSTGSNTDQSEAHVMLLAMNTQDGSVAYQKSFDVHKGVNDRGYAIKLDGKGGAYLGGSGNSRAMLLHLKDMATNPSITWAKEPSLGLGGNINALDVDGDGNAYLSLDRRGATTYFSAAKVDTSGEVTWAKTYEGTNGDRNNTHSVRVIGDYVYVGGRTAQPNFDTQAGDGLLVRLKKNDGAFDWATFHFSGTAPDVLAEHRIKNVLLLGNDLYVGGQVYTGNNNGVTYEGRWINGREKLTDYDQLMMGRLTPSALMDLPNSKLQDSNAVGEWVNAPRTMLLQNGMDKKNGNPPDGDVFISKIKLN